MRLLPILLIYVGTTLCIDTLGAQSDLDDSVTADIAVFLNSKSKVKDAFPEKVHGIDSQLRFKISEFIKKYGHLDMPHYTQFGRSITAHIIDKKPVKMFIISINPPIMIHENKIYGGRTSEEFIEQLIGSPHVARWWDSLLISSAHADILTHGAFAIGGYFLGKHYEEKRSEEEIEELKRKENEVLKSRLMAGRSKPRLTVDEESQRMSQVALSAYGGKGRCEQKNSQLYPNMQMSYKKENNVLIVGLKLIGAEHRIEFRKNTLNGQEALYVCDKPGGNSCQKADSEALNNANTSIADTKNRKKKNAVIDDAQKQIDQLYSPENNADLNAENKPSTQPDVSVEKFMKEKGISYSNLPDLNNLGEDFLEEKNLQDLYAKFKVEAQKKIQEQQKKAREESRYMDEVKDWGTLLKNALAFEVKFEDFKRLAKNSMVLATGASLKEFDEEAHQCCAYPFGSDATIFLDQNLRKRIENKKPFRLSDVSRTNPGIFLTEKDFEDYIEWRSLKFKEKFDKLDSARQLREDSFNQKEQKIIAEIRKKLGLKENENFPDCKNKKINFTNYSVKRFNSKSELLKEKEVNQSIINCNIHEFRERELPMLPSLQVLSSEGNKLMDLASCCVDMKCLVEFKKYTNANDTFRESKSQRGRQ